MRKKIRNLHSKSPKHYWKILNSIKPKDRNSYPPLSGLHDFFKQINTSNVNELNQLPYGYNLLDNDEILNSPITMNEIKKIISRTNNDKTPANDLIINEYLKSTKELMSPLYVLFFNTILDTGTLPDKWLEGTIKLIFKK